MLIKKPVDNRENVTLSIQRDAVGGHAVQLPSESSLSSWRDKLIARLAAKDFLSEIAVYSAFVVLVFIVCYGNFATDRYHQTTSVRLVTNNFLEVKSSSSFWSWLKGDGIPVLYNVTWYNGMSFNEAEGFISSKKTFLIGMPRLRQLRVKTDTSCLDKVPNQFQDLFHINTCLPQYSVLTEDKTPFSLPGWLPLPVNTSTSTSHIFDDLCPKPWRYSNANTMQSLPYMSYGILYSGSGYVADLGYNQSTALYIADNLESKGWIDDFTGAVFVEFTLFSPTTKLFSSVKLLLERLPYGAANTYQRIDTFKVYSTSNKTFLQFCQFFLLIMMLIIIGMELKSLLIERTRYFKNFWNFLQWLQVGTVVCAVVISYFKESYTSTFLKRIQENPFKTSSSDYIVLWSDLETLLLSIVIFLLTIRLLRIIRFNRFIKDLVACLKSAKVMAGPLIVLFVIVMVALSSMANILFGDSSYNFSTFSRSLSKMVQLLAGGKLFQKETYFAESSFGLVFGILYTTTTTVFLVNVFASVLIDSLNESRNKKSDRDNVNPMDEIRSWSRKIFRMKRKETDKAKRTANKYRVLQLNGDTNGVTKHQNSKKESIVLYKDTNGNQNVETSL